MVHSNMCANFLTSPEFVSWEITNQCNLSCDYCSTAWFDELRGKVLSTAQCLSVVKTLSDANVLRVAIEGGEPLLRPDLWQILAALEKTGITTTIATNGILVDHEFIKKLRDLGISSVQISLDGSCPEVHDSIRGQGTFEQCYRALNILVDSGLKTAISATVSPGNYADVPSLSRLAIKLGVDHIRFRYEVPLGVKNRYWCTRERVKALAESIRSIEEENHTDTKIIQPTLKFLRGESAKEEDGTLLDVLAGSREMICEAGTVLCVIACDGSVFPCSYFRSRDFIAGNILDGGLEEVWLKSPVMKRFRSLGELPDGCSCCPTRILCHGGCRAFAYLVTGNIGGKDPRCWK